MDIHKSSTPSGSAVSLVAVDRTERAVLENLGQLYRHDLSEVYGLFPNSDGTFNNRRLDAFRAGLNSEHHAWLIRVADRLGGFVMSRRLGDGAMSISDFFVVRAARRSGIGREAARLVIGQFIGQWRIAYQSYNLGVQGFWARVATDAVGDNWSTYEDEPGDNARPADTWITFRTVP